MSLPWRQRKSNSLPRRIFSPRPPAAETQNLAEVLRADDQDGGGVSAEAESNARPNLLRTLSHGQEIPGKRPTIAKGSRQNNGPPIAYLNRSGSNRAKKSIPRSLTRRDTSINPSQNLATAACSTSESQEENTSSSIPETPGTKAMKTQNFKPARVGETPIRKLRHRNGRLFKSPTPERSPQGTALFENTEVDDEEQRGRSIRRGSLEAALRPFVTAGRAISSSWKSSSRTQNESGPTHGLLTSPNQFTLQRARGTPEGTMMMKMPSSTDTSQRSDERSRNSSALLASQSRLPALKKVSTYAVLPTPQLTDQMGTSTQNLVEGKIHRASTAKKETIQPRYSVPRFSVTSHLDKSSTQRKSPLNLKSAPQPSGYSIPRGPTIAKLAPNNSSSKAANTTTHIAKAGEDPNLLRPTRGSTSAQPSNRALTTQWSFETDDSDIFYDARGEVFGCSDRGTKPSPSLEVPRVVNQTSVMSIRKPWTDSPPKRNSDLMTSPDNTLPCNYDRSSPLILEENDFVVSKKTSAPATPCRLPRTDNMLATGQSDSPGGPYNPFEYKRKISLPTSSKRRETRPQLKRKAALSLSKSGVGYNRATKTVELNGYASRAKLRSNTQPNSLNSSSRFAKSPLSATSHSSPHVSFSEDTPDLKGKNTMPAYQQVGMHQPAMADRHSSWNSIPEGSDSLNSSRISSDGTVIVTPINLTQPSRTGSEQFGSSAAAIKAPISKMFVICCNCRYFQDLPSKVYACMAQPNKVVSDERLGVSGAVSTRVTCPWCKHGMSRDCCEGWKARVNFEERLH